MTARKARRTRSRQRANRLVLAVLVLLALAGLYGLAGIKRAVLLTAGGPAGPAGRLTVSSALVACPAPGTAGVTGGGIAQVSAPARTSTGQVALTLLKPAAAPQSPAAVSISAPPGQLTVRSVRNAAAVPKKLAAMTSMAHGLVPTSRAKGGLIISATGSNAQGFDVEQLSPAGLPVARCQAPGSDFWFVGPETTSTRTELYLINADSTSADAHVGVQTDSGPRLGAQDSGIIVPPYSMVVQSLDKLVRSAKAAAFHVTTSTGRVVAAIRMTGSAGKAGAWLPVAQEPATTQVLTGLPATAGTRELYITVPGSAAARIKVTAVTTRGSYQPTEPSGGSGISVLGRLTTGILIPSLSGNPGSIRISSNVPVTGVLEVSGGPPGAPGAFIGGADPITEQGVIAASPVGSAGKTQLVLSAPGRAAKVRISEAVAGAPLTGQAGQQVDIAARSATKVKIGLPKNAGRGVKLVAILVTPLPGSGPVYAARLANVGGTLQTALPFVSSPTVIDLPEVRQSLASVLGH